MESKEFSKHLIKSFDVERKGKSLNIKGAEPLPQEIDYNNDESVKIMATKAIKTADGLYSLIKNNCDTSNPGISSDDRLEMYLALTGLACEIYMKSIIYFENRHDGNKCRGHKLNDLFELMPDAHKDAIKERIKNIEIILPTVGDVFKALRYDYELNHIQGDYLILFDLMDELKIISDGYPRMTVGEIRYANEGLSIE